MQVKKFEASTVQEALAIVKTQMGPDAVILSVKDHRKAFGLVGRGSVEITAAVSARSLEKKLQVEARLKEEQRKQFQSIPARQQKKIMAKIDGRPQPTVPARASSRPPTDTPYIEISDDEPKRHQAKVYDRSAGRANRATANAIETPVLASDLAESEGSRRVKEAAKRAWSIVSQEERNPAPAGERSTTASVDVQALKVEISELKKMIEGLRDQTGSPLRRLHPGAEDGIIYEASFMFEKLQSAGISRDIILKILTLAQSQLSENEVRRRAPLEAWVAKYILENTRVATNSLSRRIHCFVGPSGQGKTSCLVKMASHLVIQQQKRVAIVTADTNKVGAVEQLKIYASILNVPFGIIRASNDWSAILPRLTDADLILADFSSTNLSTDSEMTRLRSLMPPAGDQRVVHYVTSCASRDEEAVETANKFRNIGIDDLILTGVDVVVKHGLVFNLQEQLNIPLAAFGTGSLIPEDFEWATRERVLDLIFRISRIKSHEARGAEA